MAHALRYNQGKPKVNLVTGKYIRGTADGMTYGEGKYARHNWLKGQKVSVAYDSLMRHLLAINDGENIDKESGLHHWKLASCNLMFLSEFLENPELDDRYKAPPPKIPLPEFGLTMKTAFDCLEVACVERNARDKQKNQEEQKEKPYNPCWPNHAPASSIVGDTYTSPSYDPYDNSFAAGAKYIPAASTYDPNANSCKACVAEVPDTIQLKGV